MRTYLDLVERADFALPPLPSPIDLRSAAIRSMTLAPPGAASSCGALIFWPFIFFCTRSIADPTLSVSDAENLRFDACTCETTV